LSITFFDHYTSDNDEDVSTYRKILKENVFACMEWSHQSYEQVMMMPAQKLSDYLKWKTNLEEEKRKMLENQS